jgi:hypothetical protein
MRLRAVLAVAALLSASLVAHADDLFTLTDGVNTITFTQPATLGPLGTCGGGGSYFCVSNVPVTADGVTFTAPLIAFYTAAESGGLAISYDSDDDLILSQEGSTLFSGDVVNPIFTLGTYDLTNYDGPDSTYQGNFTLTISSITPSATPEPSSIALLGTGLLGFAGILRRRLA